MRRLLVLIILVRLDRQYFLLATSADTRWRVGWFRVDLGVDIVVFVSSASWQLLLGYRVESACVDKARGVQVMLSYCAVWRSLRVYSTEIMPIFRHSGGLAYLVRLVLSGQLFLTDGRPEADSRKTRRAL